jgi:membrane associated rhomboid family serine protease
MEAAQRLGPTLRSDGQLKENTKKNYPIFIIGISLIQTGFFFFDVLTYTRKGKTFGWYDDDNFFDYNHMLILNPFKRWEVWRIYTHSLYHAGGQHLFFNMLLQLVSGEFLLKTSKDFSFDYSWIRSGIPLERECGSLRMAAVQSLGVLVASL